MSIQYIELRKKYYDGNMVREAVMSVTDDYDTIMKLLKAFSDQPPLTDVTEVVRCKDCRYWGLTNFVQAPTGWCGRQETTRNPDWYCAGGERKGEER